MKDKGSVLIEVIVGAAILAVIALAFLGSFSILTKMHERNMLFIKGDLLAEEGLEALRFIKAGGWSNLSGLPSGATRYLSVGASSWSVVAAPAEVVDGVFYRTVKVYQVSRNASDDIVSSGGTVDPNTLLTESDVAWSYRGATTTVVYKAYVTNI